MPQSIRVAHLQPQRVLLQFERFLRAIIDDIAAEGGEELV